MNTDLEIGFNDKEWSKFQYISEKIAFTCALLFVFFIPISPALMNIFIFLTLVFVLLTRNYKNHITTAWRNPIVKFGLLLYAYIAIGIIWSPVESSASPYLILNKYNELWYLILLMPLFSSEKRQSIGVNVFLASMLSILLMSYSMYFGLLEEIKIVINADHVTNLTINGGFRTHIITGILMAFATFILANRMFINRNNLFFYTFFSLAALYYIVYINIGTTGQILVLGLITLLLIQHFKWVSIVYIPVFFTLIIGYYIYGNHSNSISVHVDKVSSIMEKVGGSLEISGIEKKLIKQPSKTDQTMVKSSSINLHPAIIKISRGIEHDGSSASQRREFIENSVHIIRNNPWYGSGTGSFSYMYKALPKEMKRNGHTDNPHSEYAMIGVQLGLPGVIILMVLFGAQLYQSYKIKKVEYRYLAQGLAALIIVSSIGNSMILDSGEGGFWAFFTALLFSITHDTRQHSVELKD